MGAKKLWATASACFRHFLPKADRGIRVVPCAGSQLYANFVCFGFGSAAVWQLKGQTSNLKTLGISIDGATESTYEKLRLGGKWDKVIDALECVKALKDEHGFEFQLHMVVQQDNWHEMEPMLNLGRKYFADRIYFNKIEDWNTRVDFERQTFTELDEFKRSLRRVNYDPIAWDNISTLI